VRPDALSERPEQLDGCESIVDDSPTRPDGAIASALFDGRGYTNRAT
jgi:hypothetical protein